MSLQKVSWQERMITDEAAAQWQSIRYGPLPILRHPSISIIGISFSSHTTPSVAQRKMMELAPPPSLSLYRLTKSKSRPHAACSATSVRQQQIKDEMQRIQLRRKICSLLIGRAAEVWKSLRSLRDFLFLFPEKASAAEELKTLVVVLSICGQKRT